MITAKYEGEVCLVNAYSDNTVGVHALADGKQHIVLRGHTRPVLCLGVSLSCWGLQLGASSSAHNGQLMVDSNQGWSSIGWLLWSTIWNQPQDHGFFGSPDSMFHAIMWEAQKGTSDTIAKKA